MTTTTTATTYRIMGSGNDETTCACCGRTDLNRVIWMSALDADGNSTVAEAYGTTCAARLLNPKKSAAEARGLTNLAKAIAFATKYAESTYSLDEIRNAIGVKFNVWATVEADTLLVSTTTGWTPVISRKVEA